MIRPRVFRGERPVDFSTLDTIALAEAHSHTDDLHGLETAHSAENSRGSHASNGTSPAQNPCLPKGCLQTKREMPKGPNCRAGALDKQPQGMLGKVLQSSRKKTLEVRSLLGKLTLF
jgi:hypothetical protein